MKYSQSSMEMKFVAPGSPPLMNGGSASGGPRPAAGSILGGLGPCLYAMLIHLTFFRCLARNRFTLASWQCMSWEPHKCCLYRHFRKRIKADFPPIIRAKAGIHLASTRKQATIFHRPLIRRPREGGDPVSFARTTGFPAFAGMSGWPRATTRYANGHGVRNAYRKFTHISVSRNPHANASTSALG